jgi:hypothetical protein
MLNLVLSAALLAGGQGQLTLTVHGGEQVTGQALARVTLTCGPDGGTHPAPVVSCRNLTAAGGNIARIADNSRICTMIYAPVTVTAAGTWNGHPVAFSRTYGNRCAVRGAAGGLFDF